MVPIKAGIPLRSRPMFDRRSVKGERSNDKLYIRLLYQTRCDLELPATSVVMIVVENKIKAVTRPNG